MEIKKIIRDQIIRLLPKSIKDEIQRPVLEVSRYQNISYSQEGEDLIIARILNNKENGFYVDVGAHHPKRFSNTYKFYLNGWRGINIDAMPGSMVLFQKLRPRDINIEAGVASQKGELLYHVFNEPALNTFVEEEAKRKNGKYGYFIIDKKKIKVLPLSEILDLHLKPSDKIDFLTIDVEGLDFEVIQSNNWQRYRPKLILIEELRSSREESKQNISSFLIDLGYALYAKTFNTLIFKDELYNE